MSLIFQIPLIAVLILAFYQDWKYRAIHWFLFPLLAIVTSLIFAQQNGNWKIVGLNLAFVIVVITGLFIYICIREQKLTNIFDRHLGIGDVLFFIAVTPLFGMTNYVLFFISGMILSAIFHLILSIKLKDKTIPLAGYLSIYIIVITSVSRLFQIDLFYIEFIG